MSPYDRLIAESKRDTRIANWITALILVVVAAAVLIVFFGYHPERANACSPHRHPCRAQAAFYNHIEVCQSTLRGYSSDDDIHNYGVATGAKSFGGWASAGHYSDNSVYAWAYFTYSYGYSVLVKGRCTGGDYSSDWFDG